LRRVEHDCRLRRPDEHPLVAEPRQERSHPEGCVAGEVAELVEEAMSAKSHTEGALARSTGRQPV
jgi:hypothetical protein